MKTYNRILNAQNKIKAKESEVFCLKDLRGLSKIEKEFIINNDFKKHYLNGSKFDESNKHIYIFITKNSLGKKQLYGINKTQSLNPNGFDIKKDIYNYQIWQNFNVKDNCFSIYDFTYSFIYNPVIDCIFA